MAGLSRGVDVLLVSPTVRGLGGVARHVSGLAARLEAAGYRVAVVSSENTPIVNVKGLRNPTFMLSSMFSALFRRASVVHAHNVPSCLAMRTASAARRVLTMHGVYAEQVGFLHGSLVGWVASRLEKTALKWADAVTAVSRKTAEFYRLRGVDVVYIPNAVDIGMHVEGIRLGHPQVVYVGRLSREKNVAMLVEAARRLHETKFVIVGDGPEKPFLEKAAQNLSNVVFTGAVEHEKALGYIAGSDILVLPSVAEGMSTVLLEAMALKTPVVATAVGGNTELIQQGETGLLVDAGDLGQLTEAITYLLNNPAEAKHLAEKAYQNVVNHFSWDAVFPQYLRVYGLG
ncbi:MAG: glycosyltransferase family 4 protein [Candidatus Caldarchaeum sp.]